MQTRFIEPLKVKVKLKMKDIIMNQHGRVSDTQTRVVFAEQDCNFKHSGEKVKQFTGHPVPSELSLVGISREIPIQNFIL